MIQFRNPPVNVREPAREQLCCTLHTKIQRLHDIYVYIIVQFKISVECQWIKNGLLRNDPMCTVHSHSKRDNKIVITNTQFKNSLQN